jgi:LPS export ABC transporter protein LptC
MRITLLMLLGTAAALSACKQDATTPVTRTGSIADSAEQVMFKARTVLTDRGVFRAELTSDSAFIFDENTRYELRGVRTTFFTKEGVRQAVLTSREGTYNTRSNVMEARKNVVIEGIDGKRLTSNVVRFEQFRQMIVSDSPFVMTEGARRVEGIGFESDPQMLNVNVRRLTRAAGASIVLPAARGSAPIFRGDSATSVPPSPAPAPAATTPPPAGVP